MRVILLFLLLLEFGLAKKVALVNYAKGYLANPINDARLIRDILSDNLNFEVTYKTDLSKYEMEKAIREFSASIGSNDIALFYYAGHGMQYNHLNYLIPLKANAVTEGQIPSVGVDVGYILGGMERAKLAVMLLDACRNNPFSRSFSRGGTRGLAQINSNLKNYIISYATEAGAETQDGNGANSPYALALKEFLPKPLEISRLLKKVKNRVAQKTDSQQIPYVDDRYIGEYILSEGSGGYVATIPKVIPVEPVYIPKPVVVKPKLRPSKNIVTINGLMYQNQPFSSQDKNNYDNETNGGRVWDWQGAKNYCQGLTLGNYTDWRLPNREELQAVGNIEFYHSYGDYKTGAEWEVQHKAKAKKYFDDNKHKRNSSSKGDKYFVKQAFVENMPPFTGKYKSASFWSFTERDSSYAWLVLFYNGGDIWNGKSYNGYALCVS